MLTTSLIKAFRRLKSVPLAVSSLSLAAFGIAAIAPAARAQTPTSTIYAFTNLNTLAGLGTNSSSRAYDVAGGVTVGFGSGDNTGRYYNALRWNADSTVTNLHSLANLGTNSGSYATGVSGGVAVGYGSGSATGGDADNPSIQALRWNANNTVTNLHSLARLSTGFSASRSCATDISGGVTVGYGRGDTTGGYDNALRWNANGTVTNLNTLASPILNPQMNDYSVSFASAISNGITVGYGGKGIVNSSNNTTAFTALRWNANDTVTDLHSLATLVLSRYSDNYSIASDTSGGVTVGSGYNGNVSNSNALRWNADNTVTDLHALALGGTAYSTKATSIAGGVTVGYGYAASTNGNNNALLWNADGSSLNLQQFVSGATVSYATAIDAATGIIVGYTGGDEPLTIDRVAGVGAEGVGEACSWTPLNVSNGGANTLAVQNGTTTTISQNFTQSAGATTVNGSLNMNGNTFTLAGGTISGAGTVTGNLVNSGGIVAPGNSPGTLTVAGNFSMNSGTYSVDLAGKPAGQYDVLNVSGGSATFTGGTFALNYLSGYTPTAGDFFNIVTATGGVFGANTVSLPSGWTFTASGNNGRLSFTGGATAVPEANAGLLALAAGLPTLALLARRRNK